MVYLRWLLSMPLSYLMLLVGLILAPVLPFFVDKETHRLPKWLDWLGVSGFLCLGRLFQGQPNEAALCFL